MEKKMLNLLNENKEWLFSGVGLAVVAGIYKLFFNSTDKESKVEVSPIIENTNGNNINITISPEHIESNNISNEEDTTDNKMEYKSIDDAQNKVNILFIDDDTKFKVISILKNSGWIHTKIVKDINNLNSKEVLQTDIFFVDIQGVGKKLGFQDEGLGLAYALKKKHPNKKVVIYSAETRGDRFHEALKNADDSLNKNAEPFQFQQTIENLCNV
jgi:hypothetical protein